MTLEQVLADARGDAQRFHAYGQKDLAAALDALLERIVAAPEMREILTWHDEKGAALLSGKGPGYFAGRFEEWARRGLARSPRRGVRQYREAVIPKKARLAELDADAERTAREDAA
jgi:hypothetical protein